MAGTLCNFATRLKFFLDCDEALDVCSVNSLFSPADKNLRQIFASHGIGGPVGNILTAVFAQKSIAAYDGVVTKRGRLDLNCMQLAYHLDNSSAGIAYSASESTSRRWEKPPTTALVLNLNQKFER